MRLPRGERDLQCLGIFVHGALASLHALGFLYNLRRRNWFDAGMHSAAAIYDAWATSQHVAAIQRLAYEECERIPAPVPRSLFGTL
ncbi:MAG TPA: hypothetical protein VGQ81_02640, partial [Acidobacteriota bacterium]|nr:hypothetical protein [Acidobacteriota bacterium]